MPLEHSSTPAALHRNMHTLFGDIGKSPHVQSRKQAIAIALETQRRAAAGRAAGGIVPHYDAGGTAPPANPVTAVINALSAGAGTSGVAAPAGSTNTSAPSSVPSTTSTSPPVANTQAQAQGVAPAAAATTPNAAVVPAATGIVPPAPNNPIQQKLMNRGGVAQRAGGGGFNIAEGPQIRPPYYERNAMRQLHVGPVLSSVPGRTDNHKVKVPAGSYVLPAQHIASMGSGNTLAGMSLASKMFSGPYGAGAPKIAHGAGLPKPPKPMTKFWTGGYSEGGARGTDHFEPVDVDISGGEYVIPPQVIIAKFGSLKAGHKILDKWVMDTRKKEIETQKKLPPPAKRWTGGGVGLEIALRWAA